MANTHLVVEIHLDSGPPEDKDELYLLVHRKNAAGDVISKEKYPAKILAWHGDPPDDSTMKRIAGEFQEADLHRIRVELSNIKERQAQRARELEAAEREAAALEGDVTLDVSQSLGVTDTVEPETDVNP